MERSYANSLKRCVGGGRLPGKGELLQDLTWNQTIYNSVADGE